MDSEKMEAVFSELLDNQKEIARSQKEIIDGLQEQNNQIEVIASNMKNQKPHIVPIDLKPVQQAVENGITDIRLSIHSQLQKPEANNWRIFLESDAPKWAVILVVALAFLTYLYCYLVHKS